MRLYGGIMCYWAEGRELSSKDEVQAKTEFS